MFKANKWYICLIFFVFFSILFNFSVTSDEHNFEKNLLHVKLYSVVILINVNLLCSNVIRFQQYNSVSTSISFLDIDLHNMCPLVVCSDNSFRCISFVSSEIRHHSGVKLRHSTEIRNSQFLNYSLLVCLKFIT